MKKSYIIALVLLAICMVGIYSAIGNTSQYVDFNQASENPDKEYHVVGSWVKEKGLVYDPLKDPNLFKFYLADDKKKECEVIFLNNKPQDFEKSEKIVVVGKYTSGKFYASNILMKCPSKYNDEKSIPKQSASIN